MSRYHYGRRNRRYSAPVNTEPVDPLYDAAYKASERRNQEHWAMIADWSPSDRKPGDATRRKLAHFERLVCLVGDADTAWRAYRASKGEAYTPPADLGWLPRYQESIRQLKLQLAVDLLIPECYEPTIRTVDCRILPIEAL